MTEEALHYSEGKSGVDQLPVEVLLEWGNVFKYGEQKYARDNWKKGAKWHEFYGSALRHLYRFWQGEDIDPESGLPHLAHALWNVGCLRYYQINGLGEDTRDVTVTIERPQANWDEAFVLDANGAIVDTQPIGRTPDGFVFDNAIATFKDYNAARAWTEMTSAQGKDKRFRLLTCNDGVTRVWEA